MPLFRYQAFDQKGSVVSGEVEANSPGEVRDSLRSQGLLVFKVSQETGFSFFTSLQDFFSMGVSNKIKIQFTNQLSILLKAGVPLLDAMNLLVEQFDGRFKKILIKIIEGVREGKSLADGLERYPKVFENLYVHLVRAGEASGNLEVVLDRLTHFIERSEEVNGAISDALRKPMMTFLMIIGVFVAAVMFILPAIGGTLAQIGRELPPLTQALMDFSDFLKSYYILIGVVIFALFVAFRFWKSTPAGRVAFDSFLLKIPAVSGLQKSKAVVQFSQTLGMLMEAGVNIAPALDIVNKVVDNAIIGQTLDHAREEIIKEGKIAKHLKNTKIFPPVSNYMIQTGEESGKLAEMLIKVGKDSEVSLIEAVDFFVAAIDPIMSVVVAFVVLFLVLAIFLPIMEISNIQM